MALRLAARSKHQFPEVPFNQSSGKKFAFEEVAWGDGQGSVYGLALGDLDGDGWPDIVAARSEAPNAIWFSGPVMKK